MLVIVNVDRRQLMLNPFMTVLTGNLVESMARSLKAPAGKKIEFRLNGDDVGLQVDDQEISMDQGSARKIIGSVFRGLISSLHGAEGGKEFRFLCEKP
jgi:hypothetical protein